MPYTPLMEGKGKLSNCDNRDNSIQGVDLFDKGLKLPLLQRKVFTELFITTIPQCIMRSVNGQDLPLNYPSIQNKYATQGSTRSCCMTNR